MLTMSGEINIESDKILLYCRFCLQLQSDNNGEELTLCREFEQQFFELTQYKLQLPNYPPIVCNICCEKFQNVMSYRRTLIDNQILLKHIIDKQPISLSEVESEVDKVDYIDNNLKHENEPSFWCEDCENQFTDQSQQDEHKCQKDSVSIEEKDDLDDKTDYEPPTKKKAVRKRLEQPIVCKCSKVFYYKSYYHFHYKDVHEQKEEICEVCGLVFKNIRRLNSHILIHNNEKKFKCKECDKEFNFSGDFARHQRIHTNIRPYKCEYCEKSFKQSYALTLHLNTHNKNIKFKCDNCNTAEFSCKPSLKKHLIKCLNGITRDSLKTSGFNYGSRSKYKCFVDSCERIYTSRKYLKSHLENQHKMEIPRFETTCLECHKCFDTIGEYAVHVKIHTCNFVCSLCKLRFKTEDKLSTHQNKFHKESEDRPFKCLECNAQFKINQHLKAHIIYKHTDSSEKKFECAECHLKFRQKGEYTIHLRFHTKERPFKCLTCDFKGKTSSNLRQHNLIVHGCDTIYQCKECNIKFKYANELNSHKKTCKPVETTSTTTIVYELTETSNE